MMNKHQIIIALFLFLTLPFLHAQTWHKTYHINHQEEGFIGTVMDDGTLLVVGTSETHGHWLLNLDENGDTLWTKTYQIGEISPIDLQKSGDDWVILTGRNNPKLFFCNATGDSLQLLTEQYSVDLRPTCFLEDANQNFWIGGRMDFSGFVASLFHFDAEEAFFIDYKDNNCYIPNGYSGCMQFDAINGIHLNATQDTIIAVASITDQNGDYRTHFLRLDTLGNLLQNTILLENREVSDFVVLNDSTFYLLTEYEELYQINQEGTLSEILDFNISGTCKMQLTTDNQLLIYRYGGEPYLQKRTLSGDLIWTASYNFINEIDVNAFDCVEMPDGGFSIVGSQIYEGQKQLFVIRTDSLGYTNLQQSNLITGRVYLDENYNCEMEMEEGFTSSSVDFKVIHAGEIFEDDVHYNGTFSFLADTGIYEITFETWVDDWEFCQDTFTFYFSELAGDTTEIEVLIQDECPAIYSTFSSNTICGNEQGELTVHATGGWGDFSYEWSNGQTDSTAVNLSAGEYQVTITDANGCQREDDTALTFPHWIVHDWKQNLGTESYDNFNDFIQTEEGHFVIAGRIYQEGNTYPRLVFADTNGNFISEQIYTDFPGAYFTAITTTPEGGFTLVGSINLGEPSYDYDMKVWQMDAMGNLEWSTTIGGTARDYGKSITVAANNKIYIAGDSQSADGDIPGNYGEDDIVVAQIDIDGDLEWIQHFGGSRDEYLKKITYSPNGELLVLSTTYSVTNDLLGGQYDKGNAWLFSLSTSGFMLWQYEIDDLDYTTAYDISFNTSEEIVLLHKSTNYGRTMLKRLQFNGEIEVLDEVEWLGSGDSKLFCTNDNHYYVWRDEAHLWRFLPDFSLEWRTSMTNTTTNHTLTDFLVNDDGTINFVANAHMDDFYPINNGNQDSWLIQLKTPRPQAEIAQADTVVCERGEAIFKINDTACNGCTWQWSDGSNTPTYLLDIQQDTSIFLEAITAEGCPVIDQIEVEISDFDAYTMTTATECNVSNGQIKVFPENGHAPYSYLWEDGQTGAEHNNLGYGTHTVTISDTWCSLTRSAEVNLVDLPTYDSYNGFFSADYSPAGSSQSVDYVNFSYLAEAPNGDILAVLRDDDAFPQLYRMDAAGDTIWTQDYPHPYANVKSTATTEGGELLVLVVINDSLRIEKIATNGALIWSKSMAEASVNYKFQLLVTATTDILITGAKETTISTDAWMLHLNENGEMLSSFTFGGSEEDAFRGAVELPNGDYLISGYTASTDGDLISNINAGNTDAWLCRVTPAGLLLWSKTFGGEGYDYCTLKKGMVNRYFLGSTQGASNTNFYNGDGWIAEINELGTILWEHEGQRFSDFQPWKNGVVLCRTETEEDFGNDHYLYAIYEEVNAEGINWQRRSYEPYFPNYIGSVSSMLAHQDGRLLMSGFSLAWYTVFNQDTWQHDAYFYFSQARIIQLDGMDYVPNIHLTDTLAICDLDTFALDVAIPEMNYIWNTGETTPEINISESGEYWVEIANADGTCIATDTFFVDLLGVQTSVDIGEDITTCEEVILTIGNEEHDILWNNGAMTSELSISETGTYSVIVTTEDGCTYSDELYYDRTGNMTSELTGEDLACFNDESGSILASVEGGIGLHTFIWNDNLQGNSLENLSAGTYFLTITDEEGCLIYDQISLLQPLPISIGFNGNTNLNCVTQHTQITLEAQGGIPNYNYFWEDGSMESIRSDLTPGIYPITVTDANDCAMLDTIVINAPPPITITYDIVQPTNNTSEDGSIHANVEGGTPPYNILLWDGFTLNNISAGDYIVALLDANNCLFSDTLTILPATITNEAPLADFQAFPNPTNDYFTLIFNETIPSIEQLEMYDIAGKKVNNWTILEQNETQLQLDVKALSTGIYLLKIQTEAGIIASRIIKQN